MPERASDPPLLEVRIEVPRWGFVKRGSTGHVDFVSPLPCPFNYGAVPHLLGLEGDLLDAVVLGPRLRVGQRVVLPAWGAVGLTDRGLYDDKLVCAARPPSAAERAAVLRFFAFYARAKGVLNRLRGQPGPMGASGWLPAATALARARPRPARWRGPEVGF